MWDLLLNSFGSLLLLLLIHILGSEMTYRNKTYICFDGDNDMRYYRLMTAWKENKAFTFNFHNAHDLNYARDSSQEESIKKQLRERFANSKLLIVLIGNKTKFLTKFVKWEMDVALKLGIPIIGVNLNGSREIDALCPSTIRDELVMYVPYSINIIEYAINNWPSQFEQRKRNGETGPYHYIQSVYDRLGY